MRHDTTIMLIQRQKIHKHCITHFFVLFFRFFFCADVVIFIKHFVYFSYKFVYFHESMPFIMPFYVCWFCLYFFFVSVINWFLSALHNIFSMLFDIIIENIFAHTILMTKPKIILFLFIFVYRIH